MLMLVFLKYWLTSERFLENVTHHISEVWGLRCTVIYKSQLLNFFAAVFLGVEKTMNFQVDLTFLCAVEA